MKAILTKFLPTTATKPARIKAYTIDGNQLTLSNEECSDNGRDDTALRHLYAAYKLAEKMNWPGNLVGGGTPEGYAFVFSNSWIRNPVSPDKAWKYVRAFRENMPDCFLIYEGKRTFGADPVLSTESEDVAKRIVDARNRGLL